MFPPVAPPCNVKAGRAAAPHLFTGSGGERDGGGPKNGGVKAVLGVL